jgi:protease I
LRSIELRERGRTMFGTNSEKILNGKNIAILSCDGFEQSELFDPKAALEKAGASVKIISPKLGTIKGWKNGEWGKSIDVDLTLEDADLEHFDAIMLPGGVINPDQLRMNPEAVSFVKSFFAQGKPVAAICHGPQTLIETGELKGRTVTSWPSLKTDIKNAGARWVDQEVVNEDGLITSRKPDDIPAFCKSFIEEISTFQTRAQSGLRTENRNNNQISKQKESGAL